MAVLLAHAVGYVAWHSGVNLVPAASVGAAGVDLFFAISGFVMVSSSAHLFGQPGAQRPFLLRRLWRIGPLYWLATLAFLLMQALRGRPETLEAVHLAASLLFWPSANPTGRMLPVYAVGWTLDYEMLFYLMFALALPARRGLVAILAALGLLAVAGATLPLPQPLRFWAHPIVLEFAGGMVLGMAYRAGWRLPRAAAWLVAAAGLVALGLETRAGVNFTPDEPAAATWRWLAWGLPCAAVLAGLVMGRGPETPHRLLGFLGNASYALYLVHPLVIIALWPLLVPVTHLVRGDLRLANATQVVIAIALPLLAAAVAHRAVERPLMRALSRRARARGFG